MFTHRSLTTRLVQVFIAALIAAWAATLVPGSALAAPNPGNGGNNGTVKICDGPNGCTNANDPHLSCPISIQWNGFDPAPTTDDFTVNFSGINPTNGTVSVVGGSNPDNGSFTGPDYTKSYSLQIANGTANNKGEYHVNIDITTKTANGSDFKSKTVWLQSCAVVNPTQTVSASGACNGATGNYEWTISTTPATAGVSGTYNPTGSATTSNYTTGALGSTTTLSTGHVNSLTFTVSSAGWAVAAGASPATATSDSRCNTGNTVDPSATASANCQALNATLNAGTNQTVFTVNEPAGSHSVTVAANGSAPVSYTSGAGATITVSANGKQLASATAPANCGGNPTPPSASATSTCSAASAHLDAGSNATDFSVSAPSGAQSVHVPANQTQDLTFTPGAGVTISVSVNGTVLSSATAPATCGTSGAAAPDASATNACIAGISVSLSDMGGGADETFTVTKPDGTTETVLVRIGQVVRKSYPVKEDTTGVVTVTTPDGFSKTFTYKKNCTKVLGEKHTVKPPTKVKGEKSQLPFTGYNTRRGLFDAAALVSLGLILLALAPGNRRRPDTHSEG